MTPAKERARDIQRTADDMRGRCYSYLQSIGAADRDEELKAWNRLTRKSREAWLWIAREITGDNPE